MEEMLEEMPLKATAAQFWGAIKIYTEKPHVINRRICGTENLWLGIAQEGFNWHRIVKDLCQELSSQSNMIKNSQFSSSPSTNEYDTIIGSEKMVEIANTDNECMKLDSGDNLNHCNSQPVNKMEINQHTALSLSHADDTKICSEKVVQNANSDNETREEEFGYKLVERVKAVLCNEGFVSHEKDPDILDIAMDDQVEIMQESQREDSQMSKNEEGSKKKIIPWQCLLEEETSGIAVIRKMIPKQVEKYTTAYEVVIMERDVPRVTYISHSPISAPSISPQLHYTFTLNNTGVAVSCIKGEDESTNSLKDDPSTTWVQKKLLPKIAKWTTEVLPDGKVEDKGSLRLVDVQEYNQLYQKLKTKYGKQLIEMWPEVTDPLKFVYEDIAIATYLLLLWRQERTEKHLTQHQSFVDLGCGNGLLVYLLNSEGHPGLGIDIKKRNIWSMFPATIHLKEDVVEPSDKNLFPEYDWLIGNHSDELTPWLPVIAAKSKYTTRFFVIPCCAYDFSCKYKRKYAGRSQYSDYLEYVKDVGAVCGFEVWQDKLRIPSTKRICLIGQNRTYAKDQLNKVLSDIDIFVKQREKLNSEAKEKQEVDNKGQSGDIKLQDSNCKEDSENKQCGDGLWVENFKAREAIQEVRNCTQLEKGVKEDLITSVANMLMDKKHVVQVEVEEKIHVEWDRGGSMTLGDIAKKLEPQQRSALKKECGGLQTLLKNHKHMFSLVDGKVSLQSPVPAWKTKVPRDRIKKKLCWFHENHKKGCPLPSHLCTFAHGAADLK